MYKIISFLCTNLRLLKMCRKFVIYFSSLGLIENPPLKNTYCTSIMPFSSGILKLLLNYYCNRKSINLYLLENNNKKSFFQILKQHEFFVRPNIIMFIVPYCFISPFDNHWTRVNLIDKDCVWFFFILVIALRRYEIVPFYLPF